METSLKKLQHKQTLYYGPSAILGPLIIVTRPKYIL